MQLIAMQLSLEAQKLWELVRGETSVYESKNMRVFWLLKDFMRYFSISNVDKLFSYSSRWKNVVSIS